MVSTRRYKFIVAFLLCALIYAITLLFSSQLSPVISTHFDKISLPQFRNPIVWPHNEEYKVTEYNDVDDFSTPYLTEASTRIYEHLNENSETSTFEENSIAEQTTIDSMEKFYDLIDNVIGTHASSNNTDTTGDISLIEEDKIISNLQPKCVYPQVTRSHPMIEPYRNPKTFKLICPPNAHGYWLRLNNTGWLEANVLPGDYQNFQCNYRQIDGFMYPNKNV
jgi:hypothetical protein